MSISLDKDRFDKGDTVEIDIGLRPSKPLTYKGVISTKVITPAQEYILQAVFCNFVAGSYSMRSLEFDISNNDAFGKYVILSSLKLITGAEQYIEVAQASKTFFVKPSPDDLKRPIQPLRVEQEQSRGSAEEPIKCSLYLDELLGTFAFDEQIALGGSIKNISDSKGTAHIKVTVISPDSAKTEMTKNITLLPRETQTFSFDYKADITKDPGQFTAVFEATQSGESLAKKDMNFFLFDRSPELAMTKLEPKVLIGEMAAIEAEVTDDKGVQEVVITYRLPKQKAVQTKKLKLIKGDGLKGIWQFKTDKFDDTGKFRFTLEAKDTIKQNCKTKEHLIKIVEEED